MNTQKDQKNADGLEIHYKDKQAYVVIDDKEILLHPVQGKVIAEYSVDPYLDQPQPEFTLRNLLFARGVAESGPYFFLHAKGDGAHANTEIRIQGHGQVVEKNYIIGDDLRDVDLTFVTEGVVTWPHYVPVGVFNFRFVEPKLLEAYFEATFANDTPVDQRRIKLVCRQMEVKGELDSK